MNKEYIHFTSIFTIKSLPFDRYDKNFASIVDGKRYQTSRVIFDHLSPIVSKYHCQD